MPNTPITKKEFDAHCKENRETAQKLEKLLPLADLIPTLKQIVEDRKANTIIGAKIVKWVGVIGAIIALIWGAIKVFKEFR